MNNKDGKQDRDQVLEETLDRANKTDDDPLFGDLPSGVYACGGAARTSEADEGPPRRDIMDQMLRTLAKSLLVDPSTNKLDKETVELLTTWHRLLFNLAICSRRTKGIEEEGAKKLVDVIMATEMAIRLMGDDDEERMLDIIYAIKVLLEDRQRAYASTKAAFKQIIHDAGLVGSLALRQLTKAILDR